jgi:LAS superfamily LD-carboxypeptidase LdcB
VALRGDHGGTANEHDGSITEDDGFLPDGVTAFDDEYPGVANLDPDLLRAVREAATDAADDGIEVYVTSGWRSTEYQTELFREAVSEYGSEEDAARWVATADTSAHVSGNAVDIGSFDAMAWLSEHGAEYGLCRTYSNESWHFELRPEATSRGCPPMDAEPHGRLPRMQR